MSNNSAKTAWDEMNNGQKALIVGSALDDFRSIGTAKTGGERIQKIAGLVAKAMGLMGG